MIRLLWMMWLRFMICCDCDGVVVLVWLVGMLLVGMLLVGMVVEFLDCGYCDGD